MAAHVADCRAACMRSTGVCACRRSSNFLQAQVVVACGGFPVLPTVLQAGSVGNAYAVCSLWVLDYGR